MKSTDEDLAGYVAGLLTNDDQDDVHGVHAMSLRIPLSLAATLMVMSDQSGKSRNEMARLILQTGIDLILSRLPEPVREELHEAVSDRIETLI